MHANICPKESWDFYFYFFHDFDKLCEREYNVCCPCSGTIHTIQYIVCVCLTAEFWLWLRGETKTCSLLFTLTTQSSWWRHLIRTPTSVEREAGRKGLWGYFVSEPRTRWRDYLSQLAWKHLGIPPEELGGCGWSRSAQSAAPATWSCASGPKKKKKLNG